jgi:thiamine-phosphate diphosphorylase
VIDAGFLRTDAVTAAQAALAAGVRFFQYRDKQGTRRQVHATAERLAPLLRAAGALFLVNDHADIAAAVGADGVHLGQDDLPPGHARMLLGPHRIIGISTHSVEQASAAEREGADYIGFGPLYGTATKDAGTVQGLERLRDVRAAVRLPVIAIGGIDAIRATAAVQAGADGVAVISAVLGAEDLGAAARTILLAIGQGEGMRGKRI